ncbi:MAG: hypothetical protein NTX86_04670 [Candidatus Dependentiae bacterium]|nr:hypothetical protein [Candidatus Dependentiae bacterium]
MTSLITRYKKSITLAILAALMPSLVQACCLSDLARPFTACFECAKNTTVVVVAGGVSLLGALLYKKQADHLKLYKKNNAELAKKIAVLESKQEKDPYYKIASKLKKENKQLKNYIVAHKIKNLPTIKEEEKD